MERPDRRCLGPQHPDGHISHHFLTDPGEEARAGIETEIGRLTGFLGGTRITPCYRTPLERRLAADTGRAPRSTR